MPSALIELAAVTRRFAQGRVVALDRVSLRIAPGERVAVVGRSGSGKTTLLNLMAGLDRPDGGQVLLHGQAMDGAAAWARARCRTIGIVFQAFHLLPTLSALDNVCVPMVPLERRGAERRRRAAALLARVGLAARATHRPAELSGGEKQRVAIARSLANRPALILADEPTGNLDSASAEDALALLTAVADEDGAALVLVTHDGEVSARFPRVVRLHDGRIVEDAAAAEQPPASGAIACSSA